MRIRLVQIALASALIATGLVAPIRALAQSTPEDVLVDVNLKDADLIAATRMLTERTGMQFVFSASDQPFKKITLRLEQKPAKDVLAYICDAAGASFHRDPNGVYIISSGPGVRVVMAPPAPAPALKPLIVRKIKVLKASPQDVFNQIVYGKGYDPLRGFNEINQFNDTTQPKIVKFQNGSPILHNSGGANQFKPMDISQVAAGTERGSSIALPGEAAGGQIGGPGGGLGGGPGGGLGGGQGGLGGGPGGGGLGGGQGAQLQGGQGLVGQSIDFISYDPTDNSIVVRGSEEDIANLQRYISMFDVAPRQVVIKVEFITTSSSFSRSLGFDWLYERGTVFAGVRPGSFARAGDPIFLNYATGNVTTRMRALLQQGYGKVVQAPVIRTLNNQPATVFNQILTWIFLSQVVSVGQGQVIVVPQLTPVPISTGLSVAPRINDDDTITMFLQPVVSDFGQLRRSPEGQEVPDILTQSLSVVARVKDGETIALAGMTRKSETGSQSKFPILGDLPIIGQFFRSTTSDRNNSELIIFVTPKIVDESTGGIGG